MGLNLDVDHVAFASDKKFDGFRFRKLHPAELGQIAGRAGRYMRDGTFGTDGRCPPFDPDVVEALENHAFDAVRVLQWRNPDLDFSTLAKLQESLADQPREHGLIRAPFGEDVLALEHVAREDDIRGFARSPAAVQRLWDVCQVPDYRKVSPAGHADLVGTLYRFLMKDGAVPAEWFSRQVAMLDRTDGDIDTLSNRIAQVRTWTFVANRPDWLKEPEHWQAVTRRVEDSLSDALHERLAQRFVDRRTSVLMRRLREKAMNGSGNHGHGRRERGGAACRPPARLPLRARPAGGGRGSEGAAERRPARRWRARSRRRAERFSAAADSSLVLSNDGVIRWLGDPVAKLEPGDKLFEPRPRIVADEELAGPARDKVEARLKAWLKAHVVRLLGPASDARGIAELTGIARGIGFQIAEALGVLERSRVVSEVRSLDQDGRAALRKQGIRFGAYHLYLPALLKPAPRLLATQLWALKHGGLDQKGVDDIAHLASSGRTSIPVDPEIAKGLYRAAGFRVCGGRAVRVDILERLADLIRPAINYRPGLSPGRAAAGHRGWRRLRCDGRHDLARRLLGRGFRLDPQVARLRGGPPRRSGDHRASAPARRVGAGAAGPEPAEAEAAAVSEPGPGQPSEPPESTPAAEASAVAGEPPAPAAGGLDHDRARCRRTGGARAPIGWRRPCPCDRAPGRGRSDAPGRRDGCGGLEALSRRSTPAEAAPADAPAGRGWTGRTSRDPLPPPSRRPGSRRSRS